MFDPFIANGYDSNNKLEGYYGSGMLSLWRGNDKLGPYDRDDAQARHQRMRSLQHRDVDFCGSCHDVSNPAVGDLAPNNGAQIPLLPGTFNGVPNVVDPNQDPATKAAFNNAPYMYGVVERTFSEFKASAFDTMPVSGFDTLPDDLKVPGGSLDVSYQAALAAGQAGNYADVGTLTDPPDQGVRYFSCQTCHLRPTTGVGCNKRGTPTRADLPKHDMTGGNNWIGPLIKYQNDNGLLRLGGGLSQIQRDAIDAGQLRAGEHLTQAASLEVTGDTVKVVNLTGHKLISGYPEGRRMWLNIKWYDINNDLVREDGAYGPIGVWVNNPAGGPDVQVESISDLSGTDTKIYEAHYAMTEEWANTLLGLGYDPDFVLSFDRSDGQPDYRLGDLANPETPAYHETFHFVLNNHVAKDNRIPPYGMDYSEAARRNALPVPATQFGDPGEGDVYNYWDEVVLNPPLTPQTAVYATIDLLYQGTSWEYIQFLWKANNEQNAFLGQEGVNMLDAWLNAGPAQTPPEPAMAPPTVMASTTWGQEPICTSSEPTEQSCGDGVDNDCDGLIDGDDPDCPQSCIPTESAEQSCADGVDNDCDGLIDGDDPDCSQSCMPTESPEVSCTDGVDNDCDGLIDGDDQDCQIITDCTFYTDKATCVIDPACRWNRKKGCLNR
jgi:hypothetical protein